MKIVCFILFLLILFILSLIFNEIFIKEPFSNANKKNKFHMCPPFTETMPPSLSYKSPSKGWCTAADYGPIPLDDDLEQTNKDTGKCPPTYNRVSGEESMKYDSKAWCVKPT